MVTVGIRGHRTDWQPELGMRQMVVGGTGWGVAGLCGAGSCDWSP